jgi:IMP dehydrogenase
VSETIYQMLGGLRSGKGYTAAPTLSSSARRTASAHHLRGLKESHPHDINITKEAPNYSFNP